MTRALFEDPWPWPEPVTPAAAEDELLPAAFARCFQGADGRLALAHLRRAFLDRRAGPATSDAELRHLEGQRSAIAHILALVERGRGFPGTSR
jgi:hypothetical protein